MAPKKVARITPSAFPSLGGFASSVRIRREKKWFDVMILDKEDCLVVRLRDNGNAFDPTKYLAKHPDADELYGIRIIQGMASDMQYRRTLDLNNLIIELNK